MRQHNHRGVSLIEAAIILPLALLIGIGLIDFSLLGVTKVVLELAASKAAREAVTDSAITANATTRGCAVNSAACSAYTSRLDSAVRAGNRTAAWIASPSTTPSRIRLLPMTMLDPGHYQGNWWNTAGVSQIVADGAVLRPGEGALRASSDGATTEWFDHEMRPFGPEASQGWPNPGEQWTHILGKMPVQAKICAEVTGFILGRFTICGDQYAYYLGGTPSLNAAGPGVTCPDGICNGGETCSTCADDCGTCTTQCGNSVCEPAAGETCGSCSQDCGTCSPTCGDGVCQSSGGGETAQSCCGDCGSAGDGICCQGESCASSPNDCRCPVNTTCNTATGACECTPQCPPNYCGPDGCGGTCTCPTGQTCIGQTCSTPPQCGNGLWEAWGGEQCETDLNCCEPPNSPCVTTIATCDSCSCQYTERCPGSTACTKNGDCASMICGPNQVPRCGVNGCCGCVPGPSGIACGWHETGGEWTCGGACPPHETCSSLGLGEPCRCVPQTVEPSPIPNEGDFTLGINEG